MQCMMSDSSPSTGSCKTPRPRPPSDLPSGLVYVHCEPSSADLNFCDHFSSLLFSGDLSMTLLEIALLSCVTMAGCAMPTEWVNVTGSMPLTELSAYLWSMSLIRRFYNSYCEAIFFTFPECRTQGTREHTLASSKKDLCGRDKEKLERIALHDMLTMLSQLALEICIYYLLPGYFPAVKETYDPWYQRIGRLVLNHYVLSFGMYWLHRGLHVIPWLWDHIHSFHHWARHPLSRNTYQDHWLDNLGNAIVGHVCAQILVPLDHDMFWLSRVFRVLESLEKHSGVSCRYNLAHTMQRWLPYAQMPHHHDWHHEGHKACNFTFSSIGGLWDCVFGTRKEGRAMQPQCSNSFTSEDKWRHNNNSKQNEPQKQHSKKSVMDRPGLVLLPVAGVIAAAAVKVSKNSGAIM